MSILKRIKLVIPVIITIWMGVTVCMAQLPAFPGAQGFGRFAIGGRVGEVYHVTNLNDAGAGSFRDAVSKPNRIVMFDIGGVININERIVVNRNIYVAGQTAPGGGITIYGNGLAFNGSSGNNIIRYIRIRMGKNGDAGKDAVAISAGTNYIFDHVSVSWGSDGTFDVNGSGIDNITLQDCIIGQGINNRNHSTGGLMQSGKWSVIRSLYHSNKTRNPKARGAHEFINSVLYNWGTNGYIMGDTEGLSECNLIGNYFIYGPSSSSGSHITNTTPSFNVYAKDNWVDANKDGVLNGTLLTNYKTATVKNTPFAHPGVGTPMSAQAALDNVIKNVGASRVRDAVDLLLIQQLTSYGKQGKIINTEDDNGISGNVGTVAKGTPPVDTDKDGMPDDWEKARGLNPKVADDKGDDDKDGYTNIEEYLSCLVGEGSCTPIVVKPIKYIYNYDNSGNLSWTNINSWTPKAVPTSIDTIIVRTGEVQINGLEHIAPVYVETNGILRLVNGNSTVNDIRMQGGTIKVFTSNPELSLTSNIKVEAPSTLMAGSQPATVFTLNGTISGSADLTKASVGVLRLNSVASAFKGNWIVNEGKVQVRAANGLGLCGVQVKAGARLDIEAAAGVNVYSLKIDSTGGVDLDKDLNVEVAVFGKENLYAGSYVSSQRPSYIGSAGKLSVSKSLLSFDGSTLLCPGFDLTLQAGSGTSYVWKNSGTQVGTTSGYTTTQSGSYNVIVTNSNGCKIESAPVVVSTDPCTVTSVDAVKESEVLKVYPNPFAGLTGVYFTGYFTYQVYDSRGILIKEGEATDKIELGNHLARGLYLLRIGDKYLQLVKE